MLDRDVTVVDRARRLVGEARLLVERSLHTREAARASTALSRTLLARLTPDKAISRDASPGTQASPPSAGAAPLDRRQHDRLARPGRRQGDHRPAIAEGRRVLLVGPDEAWRRLTTYLFEEAGYSVCAAADACQALASATRLLPDVLLVQMAAPDTLDLLARLPGASSTRDVPVVVLTRSLRSHHARRARAAGGVTMLPHPLDAEVLVGEVDTLIAAGPRAQRTLKRRLLDLQELARYYTPDAEGQARLRDLIDRLQVAIFAVDERGHCIAASQGATRLTGYSRRQLLTTSVFQSGFPGGDVSDERWLGFLTDRQYAGTTTITNQAGEDVAVYAAAVAEILPGFHVAAFTAA